ncbi:MAG: HAD-IA family hydrolase [Gammaproteobacteria bacterium]|nr:HAD-IA family hydrolase [Gammaproteobacteria bacterium]
MTTTDAGGRSPISLVLLDLDGTFADTAPDLAYALNQTLIGNGKTPLTLDRIKPGVSHGSVALIRIGFGIESDHLDFPAHRQQLLDTYLQNITRETRLFPGMEELLSQLEQREIPWGIVTNKPSWLTGPLMEQMGFKDRAVVIVSGDTTSRSKPHPLPIQHACRLAGHEPANALYIGDAQRDIEAGNRAGNITLAALFGYIDEDDNPHDWGADGYISHPMEVLNWLQPAVDKIIN